MFPFLSPRILCFPQIPGALHCGNKWHFPYFWLMLSVSSSLRLSVTLGKENSVGQKAKWDPGLAHVEQPRSGSQLEKSDRWW